MKKFKLGNFYTLLDRTAFFNSEDILSGYFDDVPVGTVLKVVSVEKYRVAMALTDKIILQTYHDKRNKFRPATKKRVSTYKKQLEESK